MNKTVWFFIGVVIIVVVIFLLYVSIERDSDEAMEHGKTNVGDSEVVNNAGKKQNTFDAYQDKYAQELKVLTQHPDFVGAESESDVEAPGTITEVIEGGFVVRTPDISEEELRHEATTERIEYALGNLQPGLLDAMMDEYRGSHRAMLKDMGLSEQCDATGCGYQIQEGPFLDVVKQAGFEKGDNILTLNNVSLSDITDYATFKNVAFSNAESVQLTVSRDGNVQTLNVPVRGR